MQSRKTFSLLLSVALVFTTRAFAELAGEQGRPTVYQARVQLDPVSPEEIRLSIEVERVTFLLSSIEGRYRLIRLRVENATQTPLVLSRQNDRIEARLRDGRSLSGILDLRAADSAYWDGLDAQQRQTLAYPERIEAGRAPAGETVRPEVVYLYVFLPAEGFTTLPKMFIYRIASLPQAIEMPLPPETAARR